MPDHREASQASASRWHAYVAVVRGPLAALLACRLCTAIAFFGSVPFLVLRLSEDVGFPVSTATLLVGALTVAARVLAMPAGVLVDRVGHLQVITGSAFLAAVALLLLGLSAQPAVAVAGLGIYSIGAAAQHVAFNAVVPRFTEQARLPVAFALMGAMFNTGAVAGPAVSAVFLARRAYGETMIAASVFFALTSLLAVLAQRRVQAPPAPFIGQHAPGGEPAGPPPRLLVGCVFVLFVATWGLLQQLTLGLSPYAEDRFGSPSAAAAFFTGQALVALLVVPAAAGLMTTWSLRNKFLSYAVGTALLPAAFVALAAVPPTAAVLAVGLLIVLVTASEALSVPAIGPLIAQLVPGYRHGRAFGAVGLAQAVGMGLGSLVSAAALELAGPASGRYPMLWIIVAAVFAPPILVASVAGLRSLSRRDAERAPRAAA